MRLVILLASAAMSAAIAQAAHAESPACRHYVFDRTRCRPDPEQAAPAQPQAEPQAAPAAPEAPPPVPPPAVEQQALPPAPAPPAPQTEVRLPEPPPAAQTQPAQAAPAQAAPAEAAAPVPARSAASPVRVQQAAPAAATLAPAQAAPVRTAAAPPPPARSAPGVQQATTIDPRFVPPYACNFAQSMTLGPAVCQARKVAEARRRVGDLVANHRCDQAAQAALATGDAAFAGRVRNYCVPLKR